MNNPEEYPAVYLDVEELIDEDEDMFKDDASVVHSCIYWVSKNTHFIIIFIRFILYIVLLLV